MMSWRKWGYLNLEILTNNVKYPWLPPQNKACFHQSTPPQPLPSPKGNVGYMVFTLSEYWRFATLVSFNFRSSAVKAFACSSILIKMEEHTG